MAAPEVAAGLVTPSLAAVEAALKAREEQAKLRAVRGEPQPTFLDAARRPTLVIIKKNIVALPPVPHTSRLRIRNHHSVRLDISRTRSEFALQQVRQSRLTARCRRCCTKYSNSWSRPPDHLSPDFGKGTSDGHTDEPNFGNGWYRSICLNEGPLTPV